MMNKQELVGKVQTVLGLIDPDDLGITLPHEHLLSDISCWFDEPSEATEKGLAHQPVSFENISWVRYHRMNNLDNLKMCDEKLTIEEVKRFRISGGNAIVELTPNNVGRDPAGMARISRATGLHVIMGTAYYVESSYRPEMHMDSRSADNIAEEFVNDIISGNGDTGICAGIIGEIGCSWPLTENEKKVLRAAALAQQDTGAPISIHPSLYEDGPMDIVKILTDAGADLSRTVMGHTGRTLSARNIPSKFTELADTGCYIEYDMFGLETYYPPTLGGTQIVSFGPNDVIRIKEITELISQGYLKQILISHDIWYKAALTCFGGWGYDHILRDVVPAMKSWGVSDEQIHTIIVDNPKHLLTFV